MAKRASSGLTIGQLFTLTFGFLLASVAIFVLGLWVGRDLAVRRQQSEEQLMRVVVDPTPPEPEEQVPALAAFTAPARATPTLPPLLPTARREEPTERPRSTATPRPTTSARHTPTAARAASEWTIQVTATNDQVQALVQARRLRSAGFEAYTVETRIGGATWYRVQAGRYSRLEAAEADARKLRARGFEAAFVSEIR